MATKELQSTFEFIDSIEFEEKVNIEDLVLPSEPTAMENIDIKQEPVEQSNVNTMPFHNTRRTDILNLEAIDMKKEPLEQSENTMSIHEIKKATFPDKKEIYQSEMENEIVKLFEEFDLMTWHDYDQMRVTKVRQLIEKYQRITQEAVLKLHEKTLELKTNELHRTKEELQLSKSKNLTLSKRIEELEQEGNQVSGQIISIPNNEPTNKMVSTTQRFAQECTELLKMSSECNLSFDKFMQVYLHHFGRQCRLANYGPFKRLKNLFEAIPATIEIAEDLNGERILHLRDCEFQKSTNLTWSKRI